MRLRAVADAKGNGVAFGINMLPALQIAKPLMAHLTQDGVARSCGREGSYSHFGKALDPNGILPSTEELSSLMSLAKGHAFLRKMVIPIADLHRLPTQFGGFPMQQPGFATSVIQTYASVCKAYSLSDACLLEGCSAMHPHKKSRARMRKVKRTV